MGDIIRTYILWAIKKIVKERQVRQKIVDAPLFYLLGFGISGDVEACGTSGLKGNRTGEFLLALMVAASWLQSQTTLEQPCVGPE